MRWQMGHVSGHSNSRIDFSASLGFAALDDAIAFSPQVMDRALARMGGRNWWTVLLGRARAQRIWSLHRQGMRTVSPSSGLRAPHRGILPAASCRSRLLMLVPLCGAVIDS